MHDRLPAHAVKEFHASALSLTAVRSRTLRKLGDLAPAIRERSFARHARGDRAILPQDCRGARRENLGGVRSGVGSDIFLHAAGIGDAVSARLVVIEDNPADILLLRDALRELGLTCALEQYTNGEEALKAIASIRRSLHK